MFFLFAQGTGSAQLNLDNMVSDLLPSFGALTATDLVYWELSEFYEWTDEAAQRLARMTGGFIVRDDGTAIVPTQAVYALPTRHVSTIHVSSGTRSLRASNRQELEARDAAWIEATSDDPKRFIHDGEGTENIRLFPKPGAGASGQLGMVFHRYPATIIQGSATIAAPKVVREYFMFRVIGEGLAKESKGSKPEVAAWARQMAEITESVIREYWGTAQ